MALGGLEWVLIFLAFLMFFGAKRIPEFARGIGQGIKEFRKTSNSVKQGFDNGKQHLNESANYESDAKEEG